MKTILKGRYKNYKSHLDYFRNQERLVGLSRWELVQEDSALYKALIRSGELEEAIPEIYPGGRGRPPLSEDKQKQILGLHDKYERNASKVAKLVGCSPPTVIRYWEGKDLEIRSCGRPRLDNQS
ncbi:hypothetical protein GOV13_03990 [Candidatus Pacearchaeota archaeon]|nr:hypothetical protein [Candidatus Pacearchaeota archaeon]